ncbi:MAG: arginyltransferase [Flavobacteriaceae bacterium]
MTKINRDAQQFYLTAPAPCPYLDGQEERKVFTHLAGDRADALNDILSQGGFRRSQSIAYRPACENCCACVSVRTVVDRWTPTRWQRRILSANADIIGGDVALEPTSEQFALFRDYLAARHADGGMADMSMHDYAMMVVDTHVNTRLIEYRRRGPDSAFTGRGEGPLVGVALTDRLADGLSMVYSFFDPDLADRSPGSFMIIDHIMKARREGLPFLYLGYLVDGSQKMGYKARFRPLERLMPDGWRVTD